MALSRGIFQRLMILASATTRKELDMEAIELLATNSTVREAAVELQAAACKAPVEISNLDDPCT